LRNVLTIIESVHARGIIHNDVKPDNFMMTDRGQLNIIDFGASTFDEEEEEDEGNLQCTPVFCSPEMLTTSRVCKGTDAWAMGIMAFHGLTGKYPFYNPNMYATFKAIIDNPADMRTLRRIAGKSAVNFVGRLLDKDPKTRMSVSEALQHPWLLM
jgi:calcium-dependent protein kinase